MSDWEISPSHVNSKKKKPLEERKTISVQIGSAILIHWDSQFMLTA